MASLTYFLSKISSKLSQVSQALLFLTEIVWVFKASDLIICTYLLRVMRFGANMLVTCWSFEAKFYSIYMTEINLRFQGKWPIDEIPRPVKCKHICNILMSRWFEAEGWCCSCLQAGLVTGLATCLELELYIYHLRALDLVKV